MYPKINRFKQINFFYNLIYIFLILPLVGCSTIDINSFEAIQIKKPNGDLAWSKIVYINRGGTDYLMAVESAKLQKITHPDDPTLISVPINLVPVSVSRFGKWSTPDGSKFILSSSVQYDKNKKDFILDNPILTSMNGSHVFRLTADLPNGKKITADVNSGEEIKNNPKIGIDGEIKQ